jgi:hypothetical protein
MRKIQTPTQSKQPSPQGSRKESKQSQTSSSKQLDMDDATILYWERKYLESRTKEEPTDNVSGFIPVQVQPEPEKKKESTPQQLQFIFPNGIQIICPESVHPAILKLLLKSLPCLP